MSDPSDLAQTLREIAQRCDERARDPSAPQHTVGECGQTFLQGEASAYRDAADKIEEELT